MQPYNASHRRANWGSESSPIHANRNLFTRPHLASIVRHTECVLKVIACLGMTL